jgi:hypothetical protein
VVKEGAVAMSVLGKTGTQTLLNLASATSPCHPAQPTPKWYTFYNPPFAIVPHIAGTPVEFLSALFSHKRKGGFFSTLDNAYMVAMIDDRFNDVLVICGKAVTTPKTQAGTAVMQAGDLRYWSFCQYHSLFAPSVEGCIYDEQAPRDAAGNYTIVISTADRRPINATPECGVAWMDWGAVGDGLGNPHGGMLIYRNMLAKPDFKKSVFDAREPGDEAGVLGEYFPHALYIPRSRQNPKILWVYDAEIIGDRIAKFWPAFRDFFA